MTLHDWTNLDGWEGMHFCWIMEIMRDIRGKLPPGYRTVIGSSPLVAIGSAGGKPDVAVTNGVATHSVSTTGTGLEPDAEIAVATIQEDISVSVERNGRLIAVVELISPRNKDRPDSRELYSRRYQYYLRGGVHLLLVDVHRRPTGFGFPQMITAALDANLPASAAPGAVSYRVGAAAAFGGRMLALWQKPLFLGEPLPLMPLPLNLDMNVMVDLDGTYDRAAVDCYLD